MGRMSRGTSDTFPIAFCLEVTGSAEGLKWERLVRRVRESTWHTSTTHIHQSALHTFLSGHYISLRVGTTVEMSMSGHYTVF